jgi:hypothetical protein
MTEFDNWLAHAGAGEATIYFEGYLPRARDVTWKPAEGTSADEQAHRVAVAKATQVDREATAAMQASDRGDVYLTQRRIGFLDYQYRATKRAPIRTA